MMDDEEIQRKIEEAETFRLSGRELLRDFPAVRRDCNGIGAAWMPAPFRAAVEALHPSLRLAADIHDRRYALGGSASDREAADQEFESNCRRIADARYGWFDPRRWWLRREAGRFRLLLTMFGEAAWRRSGEEAEENE